MSDKKPKGYLSPHFNLSEFACHDPQHTPVPADHVEALAKFCHRVLEPLREQFGPCRVSSGYRTAAWNARTPGAATNSWHIYTAHPGEVGGDFEFAKGSVNDWAAAALKNKFAGGVSAYESDGHVHIDSGPRRTW